MKLKILLLGKNGQVGSELQPLLSRLGELIAFGHHQLDLADPDAIRRTLRELRPHLIVNAAGYTSVDQAETESALAEAVNTRAPAVMAEEAKKLGAALVHYSTDYVFDGGKSMPYEETDEPNPINAYGRTKLAGEQAIRETGVSHLILRTSWVYATQGRNFLLTILRLASQREEIRVVADQIGAPTWSRMVALGTTHILSTIVSREWRHSHVGEFSGVYHLTAAGQTSWYELARAIMDECSTARDLGPWFTAVTGGRPLIVQHVIPIATSAYATSARRPAYSMLSNNKALQTFGIQLAHWRTQLRLALRDTAAEDIPNSAILESH